MVTPVEENIAIRPVEFYGNGLPRPRFDDNTQFNSFRVDPLLSSARDAHWSMGGLNFTRLRLQGRIEGNVNKLRPQLEKYTPVKLESGSSEKKMKMSGYESPPAAPITLKRKRFIDLNDEDELSFEGLARIRRNLSEDFDRVAGENNAKVVEANKKTVESESVEKNLKEKKAVEVNQTSSTRTSPRLSKRRSS